MWGSIAGAAASLASKFVGPDSGSRANKAQGYWNEVGRQQWERQFAENKRLTDHGLQLRVKDAKRAGLHPLFALGANLPSGQAPQFIPGQFETGSAGGDAIGAALGNAGAALDSYLARPNAYERQQTRYTKAQAAAQARVQETRNQELHDARVRQLNAQSFSDIVGAMGRNSAIARGAGLANITRPPLTPAASLREAIQREQTDRRAAAEPAPKDLVIHTPLGGITVPRNMSPAEEGERWFGEGGALLLGGLNLAGALGSQLGISLFDWGHSARGNIKKIEGGHPWADRRK